MQQLTTGTLLRGGSYKIEKVLGQGSFGITYLAEHTNLGRKVAIKEFFMKELNSRGEDGSITGMTDGSLSQNYCRKFQKEAVNLSRLDHPNIVRVTDSFSENGTFYYVMDYIEGQNLNEYVKTHHVDEAEAVSIIKSVADALIYMHEEKHMLHLDLKPGNVMRRASDGHIFLIDFGLSKHYSEDGQPETSTTIGLGTAGYAPVEQGNRAKNGEFRPTIDVYAIGATFYKLLTRETPPEASVLVSDDELLEESLHEKGVSDSLIKVITGAMCPNIRKRTQTIREFKDSLDFSSSASSSTTLPKDEPVETDEKEKTIVARQTSAGNAGPAQEESPRILLARKYSETFRVSMAEALNFVNSVGMASAREEIDKVNGPVPSASRSDEKGKSVYDEYKNEEWWKRNAIRPFSFKGRIGRIQLLVSYIIGFAAWSLSFGILEGIFYGPNESVGIVGFLICTVVFMWFIYAQCAKRCHDMGYSGAWMFVPVWNLLLFFKAGEKEDNQYGQGTGKKENSQSAVIAAVIIFVLPIIIIAISQNMGNRGVIDDANTYGAAADTLCVDTTDTDTTAIAY